MRRGLQHAGAVQIGFGDFAFHWSLLGGSGHDLGLGTRFDPIHFLADLVWHAFHLFRGFDRAFEKRRSFEVRGAKSPVTILCRDFDFHAAIGELHPGIRGIIDHGAVWLGDTDLRRAAWPNLTQEIRGIHGWQFGRMIDIRRWPMMPSLGPFLEIAIAILRTWSLMLALPASAIGRLLMIRAAAPLSARAMFATLMFTAPFDPLHRGRNDRDRTSGDV